MKKLFIILLMIALVSVFVFAGCAQTSPTTTAPTTTAPTTTAAMTTTQLAQPIKIGAILPITGAMASFGVFYKQAIEYRLEEAGGKVAGIPVELIIEDDKSTDPAAALDKAKKLIEGDKVSILLGPMMSGLHAAVEPYIEQVKIPSLCLTRSNIEAITQGDWSFLPHGVVTDDTRPMGWFAYDDMGFRKVDNLASDMLAGRQYMGGAMEEFVKKGGIVVQEQWAPFPTKDFGPYVSALKDADALITFLGGADTVNFLKVFNDFGLNEQMKLVIMMSEEHFLQEQMAAFGDKILGITGSNDYISGLDNEANKKFVAGMTAKTGKIPNAIHSRGYNTMNVALAALEATKGDTTPEKLRQAILGVKLNNPSGPMYFTSSGIGIQNIYIVEIKKIDGGYGWVIDKTYPEFGKDLY